MIDIEGLSRDEKLDLMERLWDSLTANQEEVPVPQWHLELLDRRLADLERDGPIGLSIEELEGRLRGQSE